MNPTAGEQTDDAGLRLLLTEHHEAIDAACKALRASALTDDSLDVITRYRELEHAVLEHMKAEESVILPAYARHAPADAAAIQATHDELRSQLYRLGIAAELRVIRLEAIDRLIATLREHVGQEDREMYPWAQAHLNPVKKRALLKRINFLLRAL